MEILDVLQRLGSMRMRLAAISVLLLNSVSPGILPLHPPDQHARVEDPKEDETKHDGMALDEPRRSVIDMCAHDRETLAEDLRQRPSRPSLGEPAGVDAQPAHQQDHTRI